MIYNEFFDYLEDFSTSIAVEFYYILFCGVTYELLAGYSNMSKFHYYILEDQL